MTAWNHDMDAAPRDGRLVWLRSTEHAPTVPFFYRRGRWHTMLYAPCRAVAAMWDQDEEQPTDWALCDGPRPPLPDPPKESEPTNPEPSQ